MIGETDFYIFCKIVYIMYIILTDENDITTNPGEFKLLCKTGVCDVSDYVILKHSNNINIFEHNNKFCVGKKTYFYQSFNNPFIRILLSTRDSKIYKKNTKISNKIILSEKYYLNDFRTSKRFNLDINAKYITYICAQGDVNFLEHWKNSKLPLQYDENALKYASIYDHIDVLDWWLKSNLPLKYDNYVLWKASVKVLEWWLKSGLPLKYDATVLVIASACSCIDILEWWKNSGLPLRYDLGVLIVAYHNNHLDVLNWWSNSGLQVKYMVFSNKAMTVVERIVNFANMKDCKSIAEWKNKSQIPEHLFQLN